MDCLIHIGMHKTATTSFQSFLTENSSRLAELGCIYPLSMRFNKQHSLLPGCYFPKHQFLPSDRSFDKMFYINQLKKELDSSNYLYCIISSEVFNELMIKNKSEVKELINNISSLFNTCTLLITTRDHKSAAFSGLKHRLRNMNQLSDCNLVPKYNVIECYKNIIIKRHEHLSNWRNLTLPKIERSMDATDNPVKYYFDIITDYFEGNEQYQEIKRISLEAKSNKVNNDQYPQFIYLILILASIKLNTNYNDKNYTLFFKNLVSFLEQFDECIIEDLMDIKAENVQFFLDLCVRRDVSKYKLEKLLQEARIKKEYSLLLLKYTSEYINKIIL